MHSDPLAKFAEELNQETGLVFTQFPAFRELERYFSILRRRNIRVVPRQRIIGRFTEERPSVQVFIVDPKIGDYLLLLSAEEYGKGASHPCSYRFSTLQRVKRRVLSLERAFSPKAA